jgi:hypothetical protein
MGCTGEASSSSAARFDFLVGRLTLALQFSSRLQMIGRRVRHEARVGMRGAINGFKRPRGPRD